MSQSRNEHLRYESDDLYRIDRIENSVSFSDYLNIYSDSTRSQKVINFLLKTLASSAFSAFLALALTCIVLVGILAFAANPITVALLPLLPIIFITAAWAGAGIGGGIGAFCTAIQHIKMEKDSTVGWFGIGIGLMGTLATAGAIVGTFIPVPVLGTLVGAASGAVMGVLVGAAGWAVSGIVGAIVTAYQTRRSEYVIHDGRIHNVFIHRSEHSEEESDENTISNFFTQLFTPKINVDEVVEEDEEDENTFLKSNSNYDNK